MMLYALNTGHFKLDGGAMFGVVPKSIWSKTNPADQNNMIDIAARCLLIENGNRLILVDTGMGNKQTDKFFNYYYRWGEQGIEQALAKHGFHKDDITDVFFTHLHFDHCGGGVEWNTNKTGYQLAFKNATYWSNKEHWSWAKTPNKREKASFLMENIEPIEQSGNLKYLNCPKENILKNSPLEFDVFFADGHTEKQMIPMIKYKGKTLCFMADLLPTAGHVSLPFIMGYDTRPLLTLQEKEVFLNLAASQNYYLFLEHDARNEIITVKHTEKGVRLDKTHSFNSIF
ncbi:MBL fold metallo-hydrolase [Flavobacteriaceae bacterium]|mgnify:FL=1|jgi:glyoxylase-like metal-dependent hydrolase (beta-lactamase superfamily II)|nr:MBL fold metallo-hydrolase [Flavobacteriaceae bacterium]MDC0570444.1 MBL fold metallo-hydrolase [Flavobacteriaceae bacterium]